MAGPSSHVDDAKDIRMILQRVCVSGGLVQVKHQAFVQDVGLYAELEDRIVLGISDVLRGQWGLKPGSHLLMGLEDRGKRYEAVIELAGHGRYQGVESCAFHHPRILKCLNEESLSEFTPDRPIPCTYTTHALGIKDGKIRSFGHQGVELCFAGADLRDGLLRLGEETVLEMLPGKEEHLVAPCRVAHFGDGFAGIRFRQDGDQAFLLPYRRWLDEMVRAQHRRDQDGFDPKGAQAARASELDAPRTGSEAKWLVDRDPLLLIVSEGDAFPRRMAESLGKKYGLAYLDYVQGKVQPCLGALGADPGGWGRVKLVLVHQRLRVSSGLELTKELSVTEGCPLPILVVGLEEDVPLKRNRAIASGAVDFISVEPFHVLRVMKAIEETLKMFG